MKKSGKVKVFLADIMCGCRNRLVVLMSSGVTAGFLATRKTSESQLDPVTQSSNHKHSVTVSLLACILCFAHLFTKEAHKLLMTHLWRFQYSS